MKIGAKNLTRQLNLLTVDLVILLLRRLRCARAHVLPTRQSKGGRERWRESAHAQEGETRGKEKEGGATVRHSVVRERERRKSKRERERKQERASEREKLRESEREREKKKKRENERERKRERERERERERARARARASV